jgi:hypothetical protein
VCESAIRHSRVRDAFRSGIGTRSASLMVVMSGFQLPSIDVAAAAEGVAFRSSLSALDWSTRRRVVLRPGCWLSVSIESARFTYTQLCRTSEVASPVPHDASNALEIVRVASTPASRTSRATSPRIATRSRSHCVRAQRCRTRDPHPLPLDSVRLLGARQLRCGAHYSPWGKRKRRSP